MIRTQSPAEATSLLAHGDVTLVDVREPSETATGHLPGARLIPLRRLQTEWDNLVLSGPLLFVCAKGGRSLEAAEFAQKKAVSEVYSLDGGTHAWRAAGLPLEVPPGAAPEAGAMEASGRSSAASVAPDPAPQELDVVVGNNVRELRTKRGWSLDVLAGMSGVGRQTLGQIELGRTVPSVATLWKIAGAFGMPFSALLVRPESPATRVLRRADAKRLVSADGRFSSRALFPVVDAVSSVGQSAKVEFYELWLAGHGREDAEPHAAGTRENLFVTHGRLTLELGKERFDLEKGDAIVFAADVAHAYVNPASEDCFMNLVMTYGL